MSTPEQRLEEMGLSVPEVAKPVASYVPGGPQRQPRVHLRPAADA